MRFSFGGLAAIDVTDRAARVLGLATEAREAGNNSAGLTLNPAINSVLADTGALPNAGIYQIVVVISTDTAFNASSGQVQHRNAANAATIVAYPTGLGAGVTLTYTFFVTIAANERVRWTNPIAITATVHVAISFKRIS